MELYSGSPADMSGRQDREVRAYRLLDELGVEFVRTDHPDEPATSMEVCEKVDAVLGIRICKNLFLCNRQKTNFYKAKQQSTTSIGVFTPHGCG